ncbi:hypothetical protein EJ08DRAFT_604647 [Tothia fuscella]|uniref:Cupin type-2 domain-containing protein n=1 Tax=Tothia fuscella TaxID=1048955 RepID=A0A9P4U2B8_9PEZI|nr:hypothetical protein EJ08DRAFT_604647 [Tothia fuscella]
MAHPTEPKALTSLKVSSYQIPAHRLIPNTSIQNKPLLIYHSCFPISANAASIESHLMSQGVVKPQWRYTMYSTTHFHSTTHEVLCISQGSATLLFGGEDNPGSIEARVQKGDAVVVPAGVGHRLLHEEQGTFEMVGAYPVGSEKWDMCYGKKGEEKAVDGITKLEWFARDPIYGKEGPVLS